MRAVAISWVLVAACSFRSGTALVTGDSAPRGSGDAPGDVGAGSDVAAGTTCYGTGVAVACIQPPSTTVDIVSGRNIDTGGTCVTLEAGSTVDACVIAGTSITLAPATTLTAHGPRPLVLLSTSSITINGTIDVASHRGGAIGAAANPVSCGGTAPTYGNSGGGGYGGSFGGKGGDGGSGDSGVGGTAQAAITGAPTLRGGCPGSTGAETTSGNAGTGGSGGGAVVLIATSSITVTGTINASGAAGLGGTGGDAGGGGGGSGGMIAFDTPALTTAGATIFANGAGGGEGYESTNGNPGNDSTGPANAGNGGAGGSGNGGDGGNGSSGTTRAGAIGHNGNSSGGGSGGGGGGAGVVVVRTGQTIVGSVAPPVTML